MYGSGAPIAIRGALGPLERGPARAGRSRASREKKEPHPASGSDGAPRDESQERVDVSRLARGWSQGHALHDSVSGARVRRSCCGRGRKTPPTRGPRPAMDRKEGPSPLLSHSRGVRGGPEAEGGSPFLGLGSARVARRPVGPPASFGRSRGSDGEAAAWRGCQSRERSRGSWIAPAPPPSPTQGLGRSSRPGAQERSPGHPQPGRAASPTGSPRGVPAQVVTPRGTGRGPRTTMAPR